jgi:hypothetical protein
VKKALLKEVSKSKKGVIGERETVSQAKKGVIGERETGSRAKKGVIGERIKVKFF